MKPRSSNGAIPPAYSTASEGSPQPEGPLVVEVSFATKISPDENILPTPYELASLTAQVFAYNPHFGLERALDEALGLYQRAQAKLKDVREMITGTTHFEQTILKAQADQRHLRFERSSRTDEAREFMLTNDQYGQSASILKVKTSAAFWDKFHRFCLDKAMLQAGTGARGEQQFQQLIQRRSIDAAGGEIYDLPKYELVSFKCWMVQIANLESLLRTKRKNGQYPSAVDVLLRLMVAAFSGTATEETIRQGFTARIWPEDASRKMISEVLSLNDASRRIYAGPGQMPEKSRHGNPPLGAVLEANGV